MTIYSKEEIEVSLKNIKKFLNSSIESEKIAFFDGKKVLSKTKIQSLLKSQLFDELSMTLLGIILENSYKAENLSAGGFELTIKQFLKNNSTNSIESYHPTAEDISQILDKHLDKQESSMLFCALNLAGFTGKISLEKSQNENSSVEFIDSYNFNINLISSSHFRLLKPKILIVDGFIESVSEINMLLNSLSNTGHQLILVARGFDQEVINTISVNNQRKSLSVFLVQVPFDIDGLNALVDMCAACNCDLISSNLGQLITNITVDNAVTVDDVSMTKSVMSIRNKNSQRRVALHIQDLQNRMKSKDGLLDIFEKRIQSLNCNNVVIRLPDNSRFVETSQKIDICLRSIKSAMDYGISKDKEITGTRIASIIFSKKINDMIDAIQYAIV